MTKDDKDLGKNGIDEVEIRNVEESSDIPSPLEEDQLQGGEDLDNTSFGSDDGNITKI